MPHQVETLLTTRIFRVERVIQTTPAGATLTREIVRHPGAVTIVPMVDDSHVCLIRNYRVSVDKTLIELPAGTIERDEKPLQTASRELEEETGYRAERIETLCEFYMSPGILDERMTLFRATGLSVGETAREQGEQIENLVVTWREAMEMIDRGQIRDAKTLLALLYCDRLDQSK